MMGPAESPQWRVFVSYTPDLADFPPGLSYVGAVKAAVTGAGHVAVDMADFAPLGTAPARLVVEKVRSCEVYVAILGMRYGSAVRDRPQVSYTELEFDTATEAGLDALVFLLEAGAAPGTPVDALEEQESGSAQDSFRQRAVGSELTAARFANPDQLAKLVARSLAELAATRGRISSGIRRERQAAPSPVRESKFVNPLPARVPSWFQDRDQQSALLAEFLADPQKHLITVIGPGGNGKTALVCRLLKALAAGTAPGVNGDLAAMAVDAIIYLSPNGRHTVTYQNLVSDLCRLLPNELAQGVHRLYQDPHNSPGQVMSMLLDSFAPDSAVVVILDNLESVMDSEHACLTDSGLQEALVALLSATKPAIKVIATTRVAPSSLLAVRPAAQQQLQMLEGLGSPYGENVLRALDSDGTLGLRDAPQPLLEAVREHTFGFPRALEMVKAILATDPTLVVADVLEMIAGVGADEVVEALIGDAYERLDRPAQQVMQALAAYPTPVFPVAVDFLLQPYKAIINTAPILSRLARRELARCEAGQYDLASIDRAYVRGRIPQGGPGDAPPVYTLAALRVRAADYYAQIRTPPATWRSLDDVRPQLVEFDLRCDAGEFDTAATVLADIDFDYLQVWGHYRTLIDLHARIHLKITDPVLQAGHLSNLGLCHFSLGDYPMAIGLYEDALRIARQSGNRRGQANELGNLGNCHFSLGDYPSAIGLYEEALLIDRAIGNRQGEANDLGNLGDCHFSLGDYRKAIGLHEDALLIDQAIGNRQGEAADLGNLGLAHFALRDYAKAIDLHEQARSIAGQIGDRQGEADQLSNLGNCHFSLGDYAKAIDLHEQALRIDATIGNRQDQARTLANLGACHYSLGDYAKAIDLYEQALGIDRAIGKRRGEAADLGDLGLAHCCLGDYTKAISLHEDALAIVREIGNRRGEADQLGNLGNCHFCLGNYQQATVLHEVALRIARETNDRYLQATSALYLARVALARREPARAASLFQEAIQIADASSDIEPAVQARSGLARVRLQEGKPAAALSLTGAARAMNYPTEQATLWLLEGIALSAMGADGAHEAFSQALAGAEAMLALAARNVDALDARALACAGLALSGEPSRAGEAVATFTQARTVTAAAGVLDQVASLFDVLAADDDQGILAQYRDAVQRTQQQ